MPSEFAITVAETVLMKDHAETIRRVDAELQEVREVLSNLIQFSSTVIAAWEVRPSAVDAVSLNRARALYQRLLIKD